GGSRYLAEGNVVITQPGVILRAQRMELTIDPESNEIELLVARGRVRYATVEGDAVAGEYARYSASNDLLVVRTNVVILQEGQVATGDQLVYNTVTGAAEMTGGEGGRVRGLIPGKQGG
ncbi:MAG: LptA/OstA family protein, partial [Pseudomonadota bacterium]